MSIKIFFIIILIHSIAFAGNYGEIASLEHDIALAFDNSLVQVDTDAAAVYASTYALAYAGTDSDGFIATFTISADGSTITEVASLEHDTGQSFTNSLVQVDSDTYALAYSGTDSDGFIKTFTISADGSTITEVASLEHDTGVVQGVSLVQVDTDAAAVYASTYALAYKGTDNDGFITTFTISADGSTITEVASLEHDIDHGNYNSLVQVDSDTYALAYQGADNDGFIATFTISADGSTITEVASLEHDTDHCIYNSLVKVDSDTYALAYGGTDQDGYITTFTISADGSTITEVASLEHDTGVVSSVSLVQVDSDTYALSYTGLSLDGFITTFTISSDGSTITEVASLEHDIDNGSHNSLVQVDSDTYALAYTGDGNDGFLKTFTISSAGIVNGVDISGSAGFSLMSSPISGQIYYDLLDELWTQDMTGADQVSAQGQDNVWTFDVSGQSWTALTDISSSGNSLTAGAGFLVYVYTDTDNDGDNDLPITLSITGTVNQASVTVPSSGSIGANVWALAGNPYAFTIDWDDVTKSNVESTVYVYYNAKSGGAGYIEWNGSTGDLTGGLISAFQGFFIQATSSGSGTITIDVADKSTSAGTFYRREKDDPTASMFFEIISESQYDKTFFSFISSGDTGKDNADGYKLLPIIASDRAVIISYGDGNAFHINNLPYQYQGIISIPLDVMSLRVNDQDYITEEKYMTLSWNLEKLAPHIAITLEDVLTGETIHLNTQDEYNFTTNTKGAFPAYNQDGSDVGIYPLVSETRFMLSLNYNNSLSVGDVITLPETFVLHPPYPNPFNPTTTIRYDLAESAFITIKIYNMLGQEIVTLINETITPGYYSLDWNPENLSTGLYIIELKVGDKTFNENLTYIK